MSVFAQYSNFYDFLYHDKQYEKEVEFVDSRIRSFIPHATSILDLGCGTGHHDVFFQKKHYTVTGVDQSEEMLQQARLKLPDCQFLQHDIRTLELPQSFDVVLSLFHVISYMTTNEDLEAFMKTMITHVKDNGVVLFDAWYGPTVLLNKPTTRIKRLENETISLTRISEPNHLPNKNLVEVNYEMYVTSKATQMISKITETHRMRYLFHQEIIALFDKVGLTCLEFGEWLTGNEPTENTWGTYWVARKKATQ